jgi:hypothetical protein
MDSHEGIPLEYYGKWAKIIEESNGYSAKTSGDQGDEAGSEVSVNRDDETGELSTVTILPASSGTVESEDFGNKPVANRGGASTQKSSSEDENVNVDSMLSRLRSMGVDIQPTTIPKMVVVEKTLPLKATVKVQRKYIVQKSGARKGSL